MSGITIPTLDEITGHTVMTKLRSLCKRFIGLAEEVDEKIDAPLEEAHLAVQTANATLATAQESLKDAQSAVTTANSASETATEASESAQESATTVAGYDTRLTAVENGKISITDINNYAVGLTGNQTVIADKTFNYTTKKLIASNKSNTSGFWIKVATWRNPIGLRYECVMEVISSYYRNINFMGTLVFGCWDITNFAHFDLYSKYDYSAYFKLTYDGTEIALWWHNITGDVGRNFIITVNRELNSGYSKANVVVPIPFNEQEIVTTEPDWTQFTRVTNCNYLG